ncbi:MAG: hypothetical protein PVJ34_12775 [Anaerolineae bacterium]|jgi:hypothetical protein
MVDENTLRNALGIPGDAQQVMIFAETSHWDPNWLHTSEEYYVRFVQKQLDRAIAALLGEPRRIYSVECMFFLRIYWDRNPHQREIIKELVNEGRLRLTSSGVITADTLLPGPEAILRDLLLGQEWLRQNGMTQEPDVAYFPDSFGSSPALPSLLQAAGFGQTAITRIDGKYFLGFRRKKEDPYPHSSAARLLQDEAAIDFVWRDRMGAEVLCHWTAFSYGQGDLLAHRGISRIYRFPVAIPDRSERNVARRIRKYAAQLAPYSPTPYLFCPIGYDFVPPIPDLVSLLDRYNQKRYPTTGIWALNAGLDDYMNLVNFYRDRLPVVELDPNPYWTGFYSARPALKERCHRLVDQLLLAEKLSHLPENAAAVQRLAGELEDAWWTASIANHHDFITGTSPDRVVYEEQVPWLEQALELSSTKLQQLAPQIPDENCPPEHRDPPHWSRAHDRVRVETPYYTVVLSGQAGGAIVQALEPRSGAPLLDGLSNDLINYKDSGGLWRMGYEFRGGIWQARDRASRYPAELDVLEQESALEVSWTTPLGGQEIQRTIRFHLDSPLIYFRLRGVAPKRRTVTASFSTGLAAEQFLMDMPGGVVSRSLERVFSPTFWPFQHFLHVRDRDTGRGLALYQELPGAASFAADGTLQVVALRNAPRERAYHFLPLTGNPAKGYERDDYSLVYALEFTPGGDWIQNRLAEKAYTRTLNPWADPSRSCVRQLAQRQIELDRADVWVLADKLARRGPGRIVRLYTLAAPHEKVALRLPQQQIEQAYLCDARERDIRPLEIHDGTAHVDLPGSITTVRLIATRPAPAQGV